MAKKISKDQIETLYKELLADLQKPRNPVSQQKFIQGFFNKHALGVTHQRNLQSRLRQEQKIGQLPIKWGHGTPFRHLLTTTPDANPLELTMGFFEKGYLCFGSALFWNGLSPQVPKTFYIAKERPVPGPKRKLPVLDEFTMQEQFMKAPRVSNKVCTLNDYTYVLVERDYSNRAGVVSKTVPFGGKDVTIDLTNLERTLIDCVMSPHYSGGPSAIVQAFELAKPKLHVSTLIEMYKKLSLAFPYWQRIGLLLEKVASVKTAEDWRAKFGKPKMKFYFDKNYRLSWDFDESWQIYYPKGLLP